MPTQTALSTLNADSDKGHKAAFVRIPKDGRIHSLRVPVNPGREWQEAINTAGPDTSSDWPIRKVGDKYPSQEGEVAERTIMLVNFGHTIPNMQYALDWAKPYGLVPEQPRGVFAIAEHKPTLHKKLKVSGMAIISPIECAFEGKSRICFVWLSGSKRHAHLLWSAVRFDGGCWFAFAYK